MIFLRHFLLLSFIYATCAVSAQELPLRDFLLLARNYPSVQASLASYQAAKSRLEQANSAVTFSADSSYTASPDPNTQGFNLTTGLSFRPFAFGDTEDVVRQREFELQQALLNYREVLTGTELRVLEAEWALRLSQEAVSLAQEGFATAEENLRATRLRFEAGRTTVQEVRSAEYGLQEAQNLLQNAQVNAEVAASALRSFVGEARLAELPALALPEGEALAVQRARIGLELAKITLYGVERDLYPVARASFQAGLQNTSAFSLSVNSSTLEPKVEYRYDATGLENGASQFQIGVNLTLSPGTFSAIDAAKKNLESAQASLNAATSEAQQEQARLQGVQAEAERGLALAQLAFDDAQANLSEAKEREDLGISLPLDTQRAALALTQAGFDLQNARLNAQRALFSFYTFYAKPLSEVQP